MADKTILITGATSGIGLATSLGLAQNENELILVGRSPQKMRETLDLLKARNPEVQIHSFIADLSSKKERQRLAGEIKNRFERLDVLINNAGAIHQTRQESVDGHEMTFALNHLAYFSLTLDLLESLRKSGRENGRPARIVNVASEGHRPVRRLAWDDLDRKKSYSAFGVYLESKLMNLLFTFELDRRLRAAGEAVTVNALHPGVIASRFGHNSTGFMNLMMRLGNKLVMSSPEKGARTSIYLATSPEVEGVSGKYFSNCRVKEPNRLSQDLEAAKKLWQISEALLAR